MNGAHRSTQRHAARSWLACALLLAACGAPEPRFGAVAVSEAAPSATLSGRTHGVAAAIELSSGCPGFVDPGSPEHLVRVESGARVTLVARSERGPLTLAVVGATEVRCDSDGGAGHAPHVTLEQPGEYLVHVGSLAQGAEELPYELRITPAAAVPEGADTSATGDTVRVSVTVTSDPAGATVRTPEGEVMGTTPAMFVMSVPAAEIGRERAFVIEMPGRQSQTVSGRQLGGAMVLHALLPPAAQVAQVGTVVADPIAPIDGGSTTGELAVTTSDAAQPIRDYQTSRQGLDVAQSCRISRVAVDVDIRHTFVADLRVSLRSPEGTEVVLHNHSGGGRANLVSTYASDGRSSDRMQRLLGQEGRGRWELVVRDDAGADSGSLRSFTVHLGCGGAAETTTTGRTISRDVIDPWAGRTPRVHRPPPPPPPPPPPVVLDPWRSPQVQPPPVTGRVNGGGATTGTSAGSGATILQPF